jgi:hypothetical protein
MKLEKIVIEKLSNYLAGVVVNLIVNTLKAWRFYFDDQEKADMNKKAKNFIMEILKNGR